MTSRLPWSYSSIHRDLAPLASSKRCGAAKQRLQATVFRADPTGRRPSFVVATARYCTRTSPSARRRSSGTPCRCRWRHLACVPPGELRHQVERDQRRSYCGVRAVSYTCSGSSVWFQNGLPATDTRAYAWARAKGAATSKNALVSAHGVSAFTDGDFSKGNYELVYYCPHQYVTKDPA